MNEKCEQRSSCAIANGLDILGDRWSLLIIRDLMFTNRREFSHFAQSGEGISTNILSDRLDRLQRHGVISKNPHPSHGKKFIYELTDAGLELAPVLIELALWSYRNIDGAFVPQPVLDKFKQGRDQLLDSIRRRETLVALDL